MVGKIPCLIRATTHTNSALEKKGFTLVVCFMVVVCACHSQSNESEVVEDSAGIVILRAPADSKATLHWTIGRSKELSIIQGPGAKPLNRVVGAHLFIDTSLVVANDGSHQLWFYSREGAFLRAAGREGSGPNEFRSFDFLEVIGDSVWVGDWRNQRVSVVDRAGHFVRLIPINVIPSRGLAHISGVFSDGSVFFSTSDSSSTGPGRGEIYKQAFVLHPNGTISDLGRLFRGEAYSEAYEGNFIEVVPPFARQGLTITYGAEWYHSAGKEYRVEQYNVDGQLRGVYTYLAKPPVLTRTDVERFLNNSADGAPSLRNALLQRAPVPERLSSYSALLVGRQGNVWARPEVGVEPSLCWHVYQLKPPRFAEACMPARFTPLDIDEDYVGGTVLGVQQDEQGIESLVRYSLVK